MKNLIEISLVWLSIVFCFQDVLCFKGNYTINNFTWNINFGWLGYLDVIWFGPYQFSYVCCQNTCFLFSFQDIWCLAVNIGPTHSIMIKFWLIVIAFHEILVDSLGIGPLSHLLPLGCILPFSSPDRSLTNLWLFRVTSRKIWSHYLIRSKSYCNYKSYYQVLIDLWLTYDCYVSLQEKYDLMIWFGQSQIATTYPTLNPDLDFESLDLVKS